MCEAKYFALLATGTLSSAAPATISTGIRMFLSPAGGNAGPNAGAIAKTARTRGSRCDSFSRRNDSASSGSPLATSSNLLNCASKSGNSGGDLQIPSAAGDLQNS
jgi:hypothetical protein